MYNCKYCNRECKNKNSLAQHEIRCHFNENRIQCLGNKGNLPKHFKNTYFLSKNGTYLNITLNDLEEYRETHKKCEICGKTIDEAVKWKSYKAPKNLCVDHDHNTNKFRGLLCSTCNRQLGWFEKYKDDILKYLNKE